MDMFIVFVRISYSAAAKGALGSRFGLPEFVVGALHNQSSVCYARYIFIDRATVGQLTRGGQSSCRIQAVLTVFRRKQVRCGLIGFAVWEDWQFYDPFHVRFPLRFHAYA